MKERIAATPLSMDSLMIHENDSIPSMTIYSAKQKFITRAKVIENLRELCQGSIINYKKESWSQDFGIPQGLNVSGVLCSLYFGTLENTYVRKYLKKGLLMRLTDDYLYIGYEDEANIVLDHLMKMASDNQFQFSDSKMSKNFAWRNYPHIDKKDYIVWIGKRISINTL
jgi:telomerase reverse transcriptase